VVHDFDPFAIQISGDFGIRWYGLSYMAGFIFCYIAITWLVKRQRAGMTTQMVGDFITYGAIGTLVGGRLGYCLFYAPDLFLKFKSNFPFWGVLAVNEGGMASHGGMIGIIVASFLFARKYGVNFLYLLDLVSVSGPIGIFFGRIANFINGELLGRPCDPDFPLAVRFPQDIQSWPANEASKLPDLANVVDKMGITREHWMELVQKYRFDGHAREELYNVLNQIILTIQDGNTAVRDALGPMLPTRHPSQLYAALGEGLFMFLILFFLWRKPRMPGFIGATFVLLYAVVRVVDEHFRMPDAHIGFQAMGLTRGQWLSIVMFVVGLILMFLWTRASSLKIQGWGRGHSIKLNRK
jgi:prolipoprotein diacylglyceryl transferase